ncbi:uncharacterized protein PV09_04959 [Verruconis gallopava]|uniref:RNA helicase n=1 Tax=Verruconis gallopava TaxID=253628 RepID=A0A0D1YU09_9PEZI|nr:uncharacterized protein PV09_04959 [Verruconis gallopava]KIW04152.1 hypothetical protein PV09_04959 [Verruconis gallopava]
MPPKGPKGGQGPNAADNKLGQYKYAAMSNLVLQADRRFINRSKDEPTGDPESLAGRINIRDMGSRTSRDQAPKSKRPRTELNIERGSLNDGADVLRQQTKNRGAVRQGSGAALDLDIEGLRYKPRTPQTREVFNLITTIVARHLGDVPASVTRSAADAVLEYLKDDDLKDFDRKKEIEDILGSSMGSKEFNELVNLGKKITDYQASDEDEEMDEADGADNDLDDRQGVAVQFGEEDEDEQTFEVREQGDASDDEAPGEAAAEEDVETKPAEVDEEGEMVIGSKPIDELDAKEVGIIPAYEIDEYWLSRQIGKEYKDAHEQSEKTKAAFEILEGLGEDGEEKPLREIENELMELFDFECPDLTGLLVLNRDRVLWVTRWRKAADAKERQAVEREMRAAGHAAILKELLTRETDIASNGTDGQMKFKGDLMDLDIKGGQLSTDGAEPARSNENLQPKRLLNLENYAFEQGNHLMTNPNVKLPPGSTKRTFKGWEEIHVPAPKRASSDQVTEIPTTQALPDWARIGFGTAPKLNRIQSKCFPSAFNDDGNMLICAPTGSGKTNVAMLTILREIGKHRDEVSGAIDLDAFKIVYISPLKALVAEQTGNFGKRLEPYGIKVSELTGDRQLTKSQIADTQIIVTTPEKWDVVTRKASDTSYTNLVRLVIIDEIHLLHDDRGPVIESIVARMTRKEDMTGEHVRIIGLSATLPNYRDVASFLRVDPSKGLFHFDGSYRPVPLKQEFIGVSDKKAIKQLKTMNEICYQKTLDHVGAGNQILIFVHSRKETAKTAKYIRDTALEKETIQQILRQDAASREILKSEAESAANADLKDLLPYGIAIHHAGMNRVDRTTVEDLYAEGSVKILIATATLAWGVNLPAHTVVIKGTQVYSPEKGSWVELSPQDLLQMFGRAGRPQFDTYGEAILITNQSELQYYLSLMNQQLPIESQLMSKLVDNLNAEIVLGNVRTRDEGADWLAYSYYYVRALRSPGLYSVGPDYQDDDALDQFRVDLIHSAASVLEKCGLAKYDVKTGSIASTELGRVASHYYITHNSMQTYLQQLQPSMTTIEIIRIFALSSEFQFIPVRQDEKLELAKLLGRVPIPVKETLDEPQAKINVLFQAYISRLKLEGLALMADLVYVTQSAGRILRAIFEICLKRGWASTSRVVLQLCQAAEKRMWPNVMTPLRQFPRCPQSVIQKAERMNVPWTSYFDLDPPRMGELLGMPREGKNICSLVEQFPRLSVEASAVPITRSMLKISLEITPNWVWNDDLNGSGEQFWLICEDCDGEEILFHDQFLVRREYVVGREADEMVHFVEFTVPLREPLDPQYFVSLISDRWIGSETRVAIPLNGHIILPERFPAHTPLLDLQPLPIGALKLPEYQALYQHFEKFNRVQTQTFQALYTTDDSVFVGASTGIGKTTLAEFAILRHWLKEDPGKVLYLAPHEAQVEALLKDWSRRLSGLRGGKDIVKLTGDQVADLRLLKQADVILATPTHADALTRMWQRRKDVQAIELVIADDLHLLGNSEGYIYEAVVSRMHAMSLQLESSLRIIGLAVSLSNARDLGEWLGISSKKNIFNFAPSVRAVPLQLHLQTFSIPHMPSMMLAMAKPTYQAVLQHSPDQPALIFVPSRKQARQTAIDLLSACVADGDEDRFLNTDIEQIQPILDRINENALAESLTHGIAYFHEALDSFDKRAVEALYRQGAVQVLIVSRDCCWEIQSTAHLVVIMGAQFFEGREHRYVDYSLSEILQMLGRALIGDKNKRSKAVLMLQSTKREYYRKFLEEALPLESQMDTGTLANVFTAEIAAGIISSTQDAVDYTTYLYLYRRLLANPSYYRLQGTNGVVDNDSLNTWLSNTIEETLQSLVESKIIELDEDDDSITPLNACRIAAYYNISFSTIGTLVLSLGAKTKLKGLLEIVSAAEEFDAIQIRRHEEHILQRIYDRVPVKMSEPRFDSPHFKAFVLLQAHFSRMALPIDLAKDQELVLRKILNILSASVDVLSSEGHLNAMNAMEMSQMCVQAMWDRDSPLKQIPHFDESAIEAANKFGVEDVYSFMEAMDPEENKDYSKLIEALGFNNEQLAAAAEFTNNRYPSLEMSFEVLNKENVTVGESSFIQVNIERQLDEDDELNPLVHAPFYPMDKTENWWLVVGNEGTKSLYGIKRVTIGRTLTTKVEFTPQHPGKQELTLFLMCDSYFGVDQAPTFEVDAAEAMDEDEHQEEAEE